MILAALLAGTALAQEPVDAPRHAVSLALQGGADPITNQFWIGPELAMYPDQERGLAAQWMVAPTFSVSDVTALVWLEGGGTVVIPTPESPSTIVRVGAYGRLAVPFVTYDLPVRVGPIGETGTGIIPAGGGLLEFAWRLRPLAMVGSKRMSPAAVLGVRGGVASEIGACSADFDLDRCVTWQPAAQVRVYARVETRHGLHLEARAGNGFTLALGKRLGKVPQAARAEAE